MLSNVWQIYFNERTRKNCWPEFQWFNNTGVCTPFFENTVIYSLLQQNQHLKGVYFGVLSHAFQFKARGAVRGVNKQHLLEALAKNPAVLTFNRHNQQKNPIISGARFHGDGFMRIFEILMPDYDLKQAHRHIIYSNYVIATPEIWDRYKAFFVPLYERMEGAEGELKELLWQDSKYKSNLPRETVESLGVNYYPMHTFVCERFWSIFLNINRDIEAVHY